MRVVYHELISPGTSDAAQLDCKKGYNSQTLGETICLKNQQKTETDHRWHPSFF